MKGHGSYEDIYGDEDEDGEEGSRIGRGYDDDDEADSRQSKKKEKTNKRKKKSDDEEEDEDNHSSGHRSSIFGILKDRLSGVWGGDDSFQ